VIPLCLILFAYRKHPIYQLIVAANRDEFLVRPTAEAHYWEDEPAILAGRDLRKMGTWMGVTTTGRFSALTNYRDPKETTEGKRSRGELVADFLKSDGNPVDFLVELKKNRPFYPGYNLLAGDTNELYYFSNIENEIHRLEPGIYGVSNHLLNTDWPKVIQGREGLNKIVHSPNIGIIEELFDLLQNAEPASDELLPKTGVSLEWERILSPMFIKSEGYGTRSSTVLLATDKEIFYKERTYTLLQGIHDSDFTFKL
jgi:uncharacterized protein with NRDE domain